MNKHMYKKRIVFLLILLAWNLFMLYSIDYDYKKTPCEGIIARTYPTMGEQIPKDEDFYTVVNVDGKEVSVVNDSVAWQLALNAEGRRAYLNKVDVYLHGKYITTYYEFIKIERNKK